MPLSHGVAYLHPNIAAVTGESALLGVTGLGYTILSWHCRRRLRGFALVLLWMGTEFGLG